MGRKILWYGIVLLFIIGIAGFVIGFGNAIFIGADIAKPPETSEHAEEPDNGAIPHEDHQIVALGDSLASGTGDTTGQGFAGRVAEAVRQQTGKSVGLYNFAVEGMRSETLASMIGSLEVKDHLEAANYILISIGGNDLKDLTDIPFGKQDQIYTEQLSAYLAHLENALQDIREINQEGMVVFLGLYDLDYSDPGSRENAYVLEWNYQTQLLLDKYANTVFVPAYDLFQLNMDRYMFFDGIHPNDSGHEAIAKRIIDSLMPADGLR